MRWPRDRVDAIIAGHTHGGAALPAAVWRARHQLRPRPPPRQGVSRAGGRGPTAYRDDQAPEGRHTSCRRVSAPPPSRPCASPAARSQPHHPHRARLTPISGRPGGWVILWRRRPWMATFPSGHRGRPRVWRNGSALRSGQKGRRFKSCHPDQLALGSDLRKRQSGPFCSPASGHITGHKGTGREQVRPRGRQPRGRTTNSSSADVTSMVAVDAPPVKGVELPGWRASWRCQRRPATWGWPRRVVRRIRGGEVARTARGVRWFFGDGSSGRADGRGCSRPWGCTHGSGRWCSRCWDAARGCGSAKYTGGSVATVSAAWQEPSRCLDPKSARRASFRVGR